MEENFVDLLIINEFTMEVSKDELRQITTNGGISYQDLNNVERGRKQKSAIQMKKNSITSGRQ